MDVTHSFTHDEQGNVNLYTRGCLMLPGNIYISKMHRTEHPWFMLTGDCLVWSPEKGWTHLVGANSGVTKPGTQRILFIFSPTVWATCHPTQSDDLAELERRIIQPTDIVPSMICQSRAELATLLKECN